MARGKAHSGEIKAAIVAELLAGGGITATANAHGLPESTVRTWGEGSGIDFAELRGCSRLPIEVYLTQEVDVMRGKQHKADVKSRALAALLTGQPISDIAIAMGLAESSIRTWRSQLSSAEIERIQAHVTEVDLSQMKASLLLADELKAVARSRAASFPAFKAVRESYSECQFVKYVAADIAKILEQIGLPPMKAMVTEVCLPTKSKVDILVRHDNGDMTLLEVKSCGGKSSKSTPWLLYSAIGQMLYYFEVAKAAFDLSDSQVHLCIVTDYALDMFLIRALGNITKKIHTVYWPGWWLGEEEV